MTSKRIFGFVFIPIAILLTLAIIGQLPTLILVVISFFSIFTGKLNSFQVGEAFGHNLLGCSFHSNNIALEIWNTVVKEKAERIRSVSPQLFVEYSNGKRALSVFCN
jgi:hypothetical protein